MLNRARVWAQTAMEVATFVRDIRGPWAKVDAALRYLQFKDIEQEFDRLSLGEEERGELRKAWLETSGAPRPLAKTCEACGVPYDPLFTPANGHRPTLRLCAACVEAKARADETGEEAVEKEEDQEAHLRSIRQYLAAAAEHAHKAGWGLDKFQDESCSYYMTSDLAGPGT